MELLLLLGIILLIGSIILPWVNMSKISKLEKRLDILERQNTYANLERPAKLIWKTKHDEDAKVKTAAKTRERITYKAPPPEEKADNANVDVYNHIPPSPIVTDNKASSKTSSAKEFDILSKLPVWIGSVSIIFAIFYLVKYSIEYGILGPEVRIGLGATAGVGMVGSALWIKSKRTLADYERIAQAIGGAGVAALYLCIYASVNLYEFISVPSGFVMMSVITLLTVFLSLKIGQPIAALGLFGGLITPGLMNTGEANALALFGYLLILYAAIISVTTARGWNTLSITALLGIFFWAFMWLGGAFAAQDSVIYVSFFVGIVALTVIINSTSAKYRLGTGQNHTLNIAAFGTATIGIILMSAQMKMGGFDWAMLGLMSLGLIGLTIKHKDSYKTTLVTKVIAMHLFYVAWIHNAEPNSILMLTSLFIVLYVLIPQILLLSKLRKQIWALVQCISSCCLYVATYIELSFIQGYDSTIWAGISVVLALLYTLQAFTLPKKFNEIDNNSAERMVSIYVWIINGLVLMALAIVIPVSYWAITASAYIASLSILYNRIRVEPLKSIIPFLIVAFIALNYEQLALFTSIILFSFAGESTQDLGSLVLSNPITHLGIPALLSYLTFYFISDRLQNPKGLSNALFGLANVLLMMTGYYIFRYIFHDGEDHIFTSEIGLIERGIMTVTLAATALGIIEFSGRYTFGYLKAWGEGLFRMAVIRFVWFDLLVYNPYFDASQNVGNVPFFNGITLTYGGMMLAFIGILRYRDFLKLSSKTVKLYGILVLLSLFCLTSLSVRQFYNGDILIGGAMGFAELFSYSVIWLATGLALLVFGFIYKNLELRKASLAFIALAIGKVFLIDAAELEGLYRVASFMGLGISMIGMSFFYTKFISNPGKVQA